MEQFLRHIKYQQFNKIGGFTSWDYDFWTRREKWYWLDLCLYWFRFFLILNIIENITKIYVLKAGTMIFEIRMKKSSRKMDSILKMVHSGQIRHFRRYLHIKYYKIQIKWRKNCSTYRIFCIVCKSTSDYVKISSEVDLH